MMAEHQIAFCAWNNFQISQHYQLARHTRGAQLLVYPNTRKQQRVSEDVLAAVDLPVRVLNDVKTLSTLAPQYGAMVFQNRPPSMNLVGRTKIVMLQYSMAKAATAYNLRWGIADLGLVYGEYSADLIRPMCPVACIGNPRLDPCFAGLLDKNIKRRLATLLDPHKPTVLYAPTWGDLSSVQQYGEVIARLSDTYNLIIQPHHLHVPLDEALGERAVMPDALPGVLDPGCYFLDAADLVLSDYSGSALDALALAKPVVLLNVNSVSARKHSKLHEKGIEFERRSELGTVVSDPESLSNVIESVLTHRVEHLSRAAELRDKCFAVRGQSGVSGSLIIKRLVEGEFTKSEAQQILSHGVIESYRLAQLRNAQLRSSRRKSKQLSAELKRSRRSLRIIAKLESWSPKRLLRGFLRSIWSAVRSAARVVLSRSIHLRALRRRMPDYRRRRSVRLTSHLQRATDYLHQGDQLRARAEYHAILDLDPGNRDAHAKLFVVHSNAGDVEAANIHWRAAGMTGHVGEETSRFLCRTSQRAAALAALDTFCNRPLAKKVKGLRGFRILSSAFPFPDYWRVGETCRVVDFMRAKLNKGDFDGFRRMVQLGQIDEVSRAAEAYERNDILAYLAQVIEKIKGIDWLLKAGGGNELRHEGNRQAYDLATNAPIGCAEEYRNQFVELFFPDSFLSPFEEGGWGGPRFATLQMWRTMVQSLAELRVPVVPRLQCNFYARPSDSALLSITHHTVGEEEGHLRVKLSAFPEFFTMDSIGYSGWAKFREQLAEGAHRSFSTTQAQIVWEELYQQIVVNDVTKFPQEGADDDVPEEYLFVPLQVADDTVAALGYLSQDQLLSAVVNGASKAQLSVVIKRHPLCKSFRVQALLAELGKLPHVTVSTASVHTLLKRCRGVITVNSGVGFEALIHLKPVITVGAADYDSATLTIHNEAELVRTIAERKWEDVDTSDRKKWLGYFFSEILVQRDDVSAARKRIARAMEIAEVDAPQPNRRMVYGE